MVVDALHMPGIAGNNIMNTACSSSSVAAGSHLISSSLNLTNSSSPGVYGMPGGGGSLVHSPVVGDYTDELGVGSAASSAGSEPRAKKVN